MSERTALDAATEITIAAINAMSSGNNGTLGQGYAQQVADFFQIVYQRIEQTERPKG
jgi:hypothetical protein